MDILGISTDILIVIGVIAVILTAGLFILRLVFRLTTSMLRLGCFLIVLIVVGMLILSWVLGL